MLESTTNHPSSMYTHTHTPTWSTLPVRSASGHGVVAEDLPGALHVPGQPRLHGRLLRGPGCRGSHGEIVDMPIDNGVHDTRVSNTSNGCVALRRQTSDRAVFVARRARRPRRRDVEAGPPGASPRPPRRAAPRRVGRRPVAGPPRPRPHRPPRNII